MQELSEHRLQLHHIIIIIIIQNGLLSAIYINTGQQFVMKNTRIIDYYTYFQI